MFARYATAITSGCIATFSLFFAMQALIAMQPTSLSDIKPPDFVSWVRVPEPELVNVDPYEKIDKSFIEPVETVPMPKNQGGDPIKIGISKVPAPVPTGRPTGLGPILNDGPLVAMVRVQPVYPLDAQTRGLEGWVRVQFDVMADGTVANAVVVDSSSRIFERNSLQATYKLRFKPRVVDGVALPTTGVQNIYRFTMDEQ